jgi:tRNA threonylcarbamoyladenosine biosynthesis protein TsaB
MNILAIDTSGGTASVAILRDETVLAEIFLNLGRNHSEILLPSIDQLLVVAGLDLGAIDVFACTSGPGSFTGIRLGVSTVKGLAFAVDRPVVALSALEVLAVSATGSRQKICPMIDARKNQVYAGLYADNDTYPLTKIIPEQLAGAEDFLKLIGEDVIFIGSGVLKYEDFIRQRLGDRGCFVANHLHQVHAAAVGSLARKKVNSGRMTDALKLIPLYLRRPEAEEKIAPQC